MGVKDAFEENKKIFLLILLLVVVFVLVAYSFKFNSTNTLLGLNRQTYSAPKEVLDTQYDYSIVITTTTYGSISIDLYENLAPENVNSLLFLIGERYYEGLTFHQVIKDFKIQGGDSKGDGTGDPGYSVKKENLISFNDYDIGMANASQFFIVLPNSHKKSFDGEYSVIGKVTEGFAVIDSIAKVEVSKDYKPVNDIVIKNILIQEK